MDDGISLMTLDGTILNGRIDFYESVFFTASTGGLSFVTYEVLGMVPSSCTGGPIAPCLDNLE